MLESIRSLHGWHHKDYIVIYRFWRRKIVKQDELDGDPEFTATIEIRGKLASYWKLDKR
jgi:hypothetical protein